MNSQSSLRKATITFVVFVRPSVSPHETTRLQLIGFSLHSVWGNFAGIYRRFRIFFKIRQNGSFHEDLRVFMIHLCRSRGEYRKYGMSTFPSFYLECTDFNEVVY
jgi:hypothetical protein